MSVPLHVTRVATGLAAVVLLAAPALGQTPVEPPPLPLPVQGTAATAAQAEGDALTGTFGLTGGTCGATVDGTWFRMIQPGGTTEGPYVENGDSPCDDQTYTPLQPGRDGGLVSGSHQPQPDPPFAPTGDGLADRITQPQPFFGVDFATATNPNDPQTGEAVPAPVVRLGSDGRTLGGDLRAFAASWNNQHFNQGAPKPDGDTPGLTAGPTGTFDEATGAFTLEWTSEIVGGPFDGFTGQWHLEGTFEGSRPAQQASAPPASSEPSPSPGRSPAATSAAGAAAAPTASASASTRALADTGPPLGTGVPVAALAAALFAAGLGGLARRARAADATR